LIRFVNINDCVTKYGILQNPDIEDLKTLKGYIDRLGGAQLEIGTGLFPVWRKSPLSCHISIMIGRMTGRLPVCSYKYRPSTSLTLILSELH